MEKVHERYTTFYKWHKQVHKTNAQTLMHKTSALKDTENKQKTSAHIGYA